MTGSFRTIKVECSACGRKGSWDVRRRKVIHVWNLNTGEPLVWCDVFDYRPETDVVLDGGTA